ncbi:MAG: hypothetical protein FWB78_12695 [Treponema sp.]|nr:hypothetical protein [Treponema sp.]
MLKFVQQAFRGFFEVILWLNLIGFAIAGAVVGFGFGEVGGVIAGFIVGLIAGFLINVIAGGFIATILNIDENLEQLRASSFYRGSNSYTEKYNSNEPLTPFASNVGDTWLCKKCNTANPLTATSCKDCGHYK